MVLGIDLGGTKIATALFSEAGALIRKDVCALGGRTGDAVAELIVRDVQGYLASIESPVQAIGVSVPGIARTKTGTVWAPNIPGWEDYPLMRVLGQIAPGIPVSIDNDRVCCVLGEQWQGNARGCENVVYLTVGTGIGAGILVDGKILRGAHNIAGSVGWMALDKPFLEKYVAYGCFEYFASGDGIARLTRDLLSAETKYRGVLNCDAAAAITARDVFDAYEKKDPLAVRVMDECIQYWGMATANLISIFNPEKIIFGGGVFGPALRFLDPIRGEARKWAQPVSMSQVTFEASALHDGAAIYGAAYLALNNLH